MDAVTLKRTVKEEFGSRIYIMTGADFNTMKDAIKASGGRFQSADKTWLIDGEMLTNLRQTYNVEEEAPFRVHFSESSIEWRNGDQTRAVLYLEYRSSVGWKLVQFPKTIIVSTTPQDRDTEKQRLSARDLQTLGKPFPYNDYQIVRSLARQAVNEVGAPIVAAAVNTLAGRYTKEAMTDAMAVIKALLEN